MPDTLPAWLILAIIAPFMGSFLGLLAMRLPEARRVIAGRSVCDRCGHVLGARDLVPLASWLWLSGKCRYCGARIGTQYPIIELAALAIVIWAATATSGGVLVASCIFGWTLLALGVADWRSFVLPDALTLTLLLTGFVAASVFDPLHFEDHVFGVGAGTFGLAILGWIYRNMRGREGLGLGDAKLLGGLGAWLGWEGLPSVILFGAGLGLVFVLAKSLAGKPVKTMDRIPFGPFLAGAGWLVWLYGPLSLS